MPTINVGERQKERLHSTNVAFVPFEKKSITDAVKKALYDTDYQEMVKSCESIYGDGYSGKRIADILSKRIEYGAKLLAKDITY